jgi:tetratricopeptide (TPR) repeat protein
MTTRDTGAPTTPLLVQVAQAYDHLAGGRPQAALLVADSVLAVAPDLADALILRGACLKATGRFNEAIAAFQAGLALEPGRASAQVSLANAHAELGEFAAAEAVLRQALALSPRLKAAHASLISVCAGMKRDDLTEAACHAALRVDPDSVNAHQYLADIYARGGRLADAKRHRDAAYRRQNLFVEPATRPAPTVLVLLTTDDGNIPLKYLLSRDRYSVVKWLIEYAPEDQAGRLPPYDFALNAIGEPELEARTHEAVENFREICRAPFLNRPDRVARTSRTALPALLADVPDAVVPAAVRWKAGEPAPSLGWPLLVRPVGSHGGAGLIRVSSPAGFSAETQGQTECDVTAFQDFASPDGLFRKYRMIFIDRRPLPYHLAIGGHWLVHYVNTNMLHEPELRVEEKRFLQDPEAAIGARALSALAAIGARLDLDYAGIDFSILPDGRVLVFEANATMVVHPETDDGPLAYKNQAVRDILAAFDAMAMSAVPVPA